MGAEARRFWSATFGNAVRSSIKDGWKALGAAVGVGVGLAIVAGALRGRVDISDVYAGFIVFGGCLLFYIVFNFVKAPAATFQAQNEQIANLQSQLHGYEMTSAAHVSAHKVRQTLRELGIGLSRATRAGGEEKTPEVRTRSVTGTLETAAKACEDLGFADVAQQLNQLAARFQPKTWEEWEPSFLQLFRSVEAILFSDSVDRP